MRALHVKIFYTDRLPFNCNDKSENDDDRRRQANFYLNHSRVFCKWMVLHFTIRKMKFLTLFAREKKRALCTGMTLPINQKICINEFGRVRRDILFFLLFKFDHEKSFYRLFKSQASVKMCQTLSFINFYYFHCHPFVSVMTTTPTSMIFFFYHLLYLSIRHH